MAQKERFRHILIENSGVSHKYTSPRAPPPSPPVPARDRQAHGKKVLSEYQNSIKQGLADRGGKENAVGVVITVRGELEAELPIESLDSKGGDGPRLLSVGNTPNGTVAQVFVPTGGFALLEKKVSNYLAKNNPKTGKPSNERLVAAIAEITLSALESLWTDAEASFPAETDKAVVWEAWLRNEADALFEAFIEACKEQKVTVGKEFLLFPERRVVAIFGSPKQLAGSYGILDSLAELRPSRTPPTEFVEMPPREQAEWGRDLVERFIPLSKNAPAVCVLDTGVNNKHPMLEPLLPDTSMFAYDKDWSVTDHDGHGTEMAGLAGFGDLTTALESKGPVPLDVWLESVKILPKPPDKNRPRLYGSITRDAAGQVELSAPERLRVFSMSVSTTDGRTNGRPSSWSAEIDRLAAGTEDEQRRLYCICAGNAAREWYPIYPESVLTERPLDPAQAWNALTIGSYTQKTVISEETLTGWKAMAEAGDVSPTSTASVQFERGKGWPNKPDLVLEGGNVARSPENTLPPDASIASLTLLTTSRMTEGRWFTSTWATSAATAQAARMAAQLWRTYPELWPETIRALLVHSGRWTPPMMKHSADRRVRIYGYGVPNLDRARYSARDALTLVIQDQLRPFDVDALKPAQMRLHPLPWPVAELQALGEAPVRLRVTLSYYIDPSPAERGWMRRYRYASHGLRFSIRRPTEKDSQFLNRINKAMREEGYKNSGGGDSGWALGENLRSRGSIHSDVWTGTAADLATREQIAVYPSAGWMREVNKERKKEAVRYSLVVSIETDAEGVDLYTPVATKVGVPVDVVT